MLAQRRDSHREVHGALIPCLDSPSPSVQPCGSCNTFCLCYWRYRRNGLSLQSYHHLKKPKPSSEKGWFVAWQDFAFPDPRRTWSEPSTDVKSLPFISTMHYVRSLLSLDATGSETGAQGSRSLRSRSRSCCALIHRDLRGKMYIMPRESRCTLFPSPLLRRAQSYTREAVKRTQETRKLPSLVHASWIVVHSIYREL